MRPRALRSLGRDQRGAAVVEFALVLPFMLLLLIGSAEAVQAVEVQRRVAVVASSIGDVTARLTQVDTTTLNDIFEAGEGLLTPIPSTELGERLASFTADAKGTPVLDWSANGPVPYAGSAGLDVGSAKLNANESVIIADVSYVYHPTLRWVLPASIKLQKRMYLSPRISVKVKKTG